MRVLVSAASRHGATSDIAGVIGDVLAEAGLDSSVTPPDEVATAAAFDAVVLGSAVYMGRWMQTATRFVEREHDALRSRPVWLFSSGPLGDPPVPAGAPDAASEIAGSVHAREHRVFYGRMAKAHLSVSERVIATVVHAPDGDFRDWAAVREWAAGIAAALIALQTDRAAALVATA